MSQLRLCGLLVLVLLAFGVSSAQADEITLVADTWCPYNCDPQAEHPGLLIEIAQRVFSKHGHTVKYQILPWARAKDESRAGKYSGIVGAARGDAPDFVFPDTGLAEFSNIFFVKKGSSWKFDKIASLETISLGVIRGYSYTEDLDRYIEANKANQKRIQLAAGDDATDIIVKKLVAGRIDAIVDDRLVILSAANRLQVADQLAEAGIAKSEPGYIAFSPKNPKSGEYAKILSEGFRELKSSGQIKEILAHYGIHE